MTYLQFSFLFMFIVWNLCIGYYYVLCWRDSRMYNNRFIMFENPEDYGFCELRSDYCYYEPVMEIRK